MRSAQARGEGETRTHGGESREDVERALAELDWEIRADDGGVGEVVVTHGKYHLMVDFEDGEPMSDHLSRDPRRRNPEQEVSGSGAAVLSPEGRPGALLTQ